MKIEGSFPRVASFVLGSPAAADDDAVLEDNALDQNDPTEVEAFDGQPDIPRNLTAKGNDGNVTGDVVIEGYNNGGEAITETLALDGANTVAGDKAFAEVTKVTLPVWDTADTERVRIGTGEKLGLPVRLSRDTVLAAFHDGALEGTRPTVAFSGAAREENTVTLDTSPDGSEVIVDLYETL